MRFPPITIALLAPTVLAAQATTLVPDAVACTRCTISLRTIATLGTTDGPGLIVTTPNGIAVDGSGRYWVTQEGELPMVFGADGRFIQAIGAKGSGPGEFNHPALPTLIPGDSVLIFEHNRMTVVAPDLRPVRTVTTQESIGRPTIIEWPEQVIAARGAWGRDMSAPSLLRVTFESSGPRVLGEFGPDRGDMDPRRPLLQVLSPAQRQGRVWSGDGGNRRYRVTQWDVNGNATRSLERKPDWFVNVEPPGPLPNINALTEAIDGTLWVLTNVRALTWREAMPPAPPGVTGPREIASRQIAMEKMYKTTIEAIDPASARVLAHLEHNEWLFAALPGGRAAIYTVDDAGTARVRIVELTLAGR